MKDWVDSDKDAVRMMIHKENDYINNRLGWLLAVQGLLFTLFGILARKEMISVIPDIVRPGTLLVGVVIVGFITTLSMSWALLIAVNAITAIKDSWDKAFPEEENRPRIVGYEVKKWMYVHCLLAPWYLLPLMFFVVWTFLFWLICGVCNILLFVISGILVVVLYVSAIRCCVERQ